MQINKYDIEQHVNKRFIEVNQLKLVKVTVLHRADQGLAATAHCHPILYTSIPHT